MQKLSKSGFSIVHLHGNNNAGVAKFGEYSVPNVLEVTFVRRSDGGNCEPHTPEYLPGVDAPNNPGATDMNEPNLPAM